MAVLSEIYARLEELVFDNLKVVSYKWLSREYELRTAISKQILHDFWSKYRTQSGDKEHDNLRRVFAVFLVSGFSKSASSNGLVVRLCSETALNDVRKDFEKVTSEHVFSVQPAMCKDTQSVWEEDHSQIKRLMSNSLDGTNNMHEKRLGHVYCKDIDWTPNPLSSSSTSRPEEILPPKPQAPTNSLVDKHKNMLSATKLKPGKTKSKPKPSPKAIQKTDLKSAPPPPQLQPDDPEQSQSSDDNDDDQDHIEMKVRIANARRNNVIMDDDDDDDDNNNDDNMPNGNDHVLKENDNVENRPENRKTPREDKDKDTDEGEASKKQKVFEIHIDSDGNEVSRAKWVATDTPREDAQGNSSQCEGGQENSHTKESKAAKALEKKNAKPVAQGARKTESQGTKSKGNKKGNQRSLTAFFGGPK